MGMLEKILERKSNQQPAELNAGHSTSRGPAEKNQPPKISDTNSRDEIFVDRNFPTDFDRWFVFEVPTTTAAGQPSTRLVFEAPGLSLSTRYRMWKEFGEKEFGESIGRHGRGHMQPPKLDARRTIGYIERDACGELGTAPASTPAPSAASSLFSPAPGRTAGGRAPGPCEACAGAIFWLDPHQQLHCEECRPCTLKPMMRLRLMAVLRKPYAFETTTPAASQEAEENEALVELFGSSSSAPALPPSTPALVWDWERTKWQGVAKAVK